MLPRLGARRWVPGNVSLPHKLYTLPLPHELYPRQRSPSPDRPCPLHVHSQVAFFVDATFSGPANFAFNRLIDTVFLVDIGFTFLLPFRASPQKGGMMVYDNWKIAKNYLKVGRHHPRMQCTQEACAHRR